MHAVEEIRQALVSANKALETAIPWATGQSCQTDMSGNPVVAQIRQALLALDDVEQAVVWLKTIVSRNGATPEMIQHGERLLRTLGYVVRQA